MSRFPPTAVRERLAREVGGTLRQVQVWFQNRRQRDMTHRHTWQTPGYMMVGFNGAPGYYPSPDPTAMGGPYGQPVMYMQPPMVPMPGALQHIAPGPPSMLVPGAPGAVPMPNSPPMQAAPTNRTHASPLSLARLFRCFSADLFILAPSLSARAAYVQQPPPHGAYPAGQVIPSHAPHASLPHWLTHRTPLFCTRVSTTGRYRLGPTIHAGANAATAGHATPAAGHATGRAAPAAGRRPPATNSAAGCPSICGHARGPTAAARPYLSSAARAVEWRGAAARAVVTTRAAADTTIAASGAAARLPAGRSDATATELSATRVCTGGESAARLRTRCGATTSRTGAQQSVRRSAATAV